MQQEPNIEQIISQTLDRLRLKYPNVVYVRSRSEFWYIDNNSKDKLVPPQEILDAFPRYLLTLPETRQKKYGIE